MKILNLKSEDEQTSLLPRLAENWEILTEESGSFRGVDLLPGRLITNIEEEENSESSRNKKSKNCHELPGFLLYNTESHLGFLQDLRRSFFDIS